MVTQDRNDDDFGDFDNGKGNKSLYTFLFVVFFETMSSRTLDLLLSLYLRINLGGVPEINFRFEKLER